VTDLLRVTTSTPDLHSAKKLARTVVTENLAGDARIIGPVFVVSWNGESEEYQVVLSTTAAAHSALSAALIRHHPLRNPEITTVALDAASEGYGAWLREATGAED
jgi:periplasmic divalent cation tolerance protein